jgi:tRNA U34 5-methylaminomethyl-2-thiouridine-forming methyltransferase MnmC
MNKYSKYLKIIQTKDGSQSVFSEIHQSNYHSNFGAITESKFIYIENGLKYSTKNKKSIRILEMGFGSGLNTLATWNFLLGNPSFKVEYFAIEKHPIPSDISNLLLFDELLSKLPSNSTKLIHDVPWNKRLHLANNFTFKKIHADFIEITLEEDFDLIYFDAFAPDCQPELWTSAIFSKIFNALQSKGILITYCAKGYVKRNLKDAGFIIEALPGPPGKREITRAQKP